MPREYEFFELGCTRSKTLVAVAHERSGGEIERPARQLFSRVLFLLPKILDREVNHKQVTAGRLPDHEIVISR
jgi:hypothetical protein